MTLSCMMGNFAGRVLLMIKTIGTSRSQMDFLQTITGS